MMPNCFKCWRKIVHPFHDDGSTTGWLPRQLDWYKERREAMEVRRDARLDR